MVYVYVILKNGMARRMSMEDYRKYLEEEKSGKKKIQPKKLEKPKDRKPRTL